MKALVFVFAPRFANVAGEHKAFTLLKLRQVPIYSSISFTPLPIHVYW